MKKYYYVGVMANDINNNELKFVYELDRQNKIAKWGTFKELREQNKKPLKFSTKRSAEDLTLGLCMNFNLAFIIESLIDFNE